MNTMYRLNNQTTLTDIANVVEHYLSQNEKMATQLLSLDDGQYIIQGRAQGGKFKQFIGLDKAITVKLSPMDNNNFCVDIGEGKWMDKAIAATVSMFVLWPLLVTSGIGAYQQKQLPKHICAAIESYLR